MKAPRLQIRRPAEYEPVRTGGTWARWRPAAAHLVRSGPDVYRIADPLLVQAPDGYDRFHVVEALSIQGRHFLWPLPVARAGEEAYSLTDGTEYVAGLHALDRWTICEKTDDESVYVIEELPIICTPEWSDWETHELLEASLAGVIASPDHPRDQGRPDANSVRRAPDGAGAEPVFMRERSRVVPAPRRG